LVPYLAIANSSEGRLFAYSPSIRGDRPEFRNDTKNIFNGPRTILILLSTATASLGQILPTEAPYSQSSYSLNFYGPIVQCREATSSVAKAIDKLLQDKMAIPLGTAREIDNAYYGFVPTFNFSGSVSALSKLRFQGPSNATNQFWMTFSRYVIDSGGNRTREQHREVCQLWNATYDLLLHWDHGSQIVTGSYETLHEVDFPNDEPDAISNMAQHAYSAVMWALTDQLVGSLSWFQDLEPSRLDATSATQFGIIDTPIQHNSLLGSSDLDVFFDFNENLDNKTNDEPISDQRRQDIDFARNRTLGVLIEELSFNMTVSLLHDELLTYGIPSSFAFDH
jgi:hypothetical protein